VAYVAELLAFDSSALKSLEAFSLDAVPRWQRFHSAFSTR